MAARRGSKHEPAAPKGEAKAEECAEKSKAKLIAKIIRSVEARVAKGEVKATVADLIRLLQLKTELEQEQPKEITVTWVDPSEAGDATEK